MGTVLKAKYIIREKELHHKIKIRANSKNVIIKFIQGNLAICLFRRAYKLLS